MSVADLPVRNKRAVIVRLCNPARSDRWKRWVKLIGLASGMMWAETHPRCGACTRLGWKGFIKFVEKNADRVVLLYYPQYSTIRAEFDIPSIEF